MALNIGSAVAFLELDTSKFTSGFNEAKKQLDEFTKKGESVGNKLKGLSGSFSSLGKTLSAGVTVPLSGIGTAATAAAMNLESSTKKITSYFGDVGEEAEKNERIIKEVFASGIPDSMEETADTIIAVRKNLKGLSDDELVNVSKQATILEQKFGIDMDETLRGVNSLMQNFGMTSEEAMDYVVTATQRGLDKTNELGDNLAEYGPLWEQAGFSAQEMFAILENGLTSGAYNLDKVNDFVKEFTISLSDGRIEENLGSFSQGTQDLFYQWKEGKATAKDVFNSVISDLKGTMTEQEALTVASTVWSSLGEDNAMSVITALNNVNDAYNDVNGAAQEMVDIQQSGATGALSELKNNAQLLAAEVGERLTPNIKEMADRLSELTDKVKGLNPETIDMAVQIGKVAAIVGPTLLAVSKFITVLTSLGKAISTILKFTGITKLFSGIAQVISLVAGGAGTLGEALTVVFPIIGKIAAAFSTLGGILSSIGSVLASVGGAIVGVLGGPLTIIIGVIAALTAAFVLLWNKCDAFREFWLNLWDNIQSVASDAVSAIQDFFSNVAEYLQGVIDNITDFVTSIPETISEAISGTGDFFSGIFDQIGSTVQSGIDTILGYIQSAGQAIQTFFTDPFYYIGYAIGTILGEIYLALQTVIQGAITFVTSTIPQFFTSVVTWFGQMREDVLNKINQVFTDISLWVINMVNKAIELGTNFLNSVVSFFKQLPGNVQTFVSDTFNRVATWASNMWSKAKETGTNFLNGVVSFFRQLPGNVQSFVSDTFNRVVSWGSSMVSKAKETATNFLNNMVNTIKELPGKIYSIIQQIPGKVSSIASQMYQAGRDILNRLWDGLKSVGNSILSWFRNFVDNIGSFISGIISGFSDVVSGADKAKAAAKSVNGSHANGLRYVPFDGYIAELHQGERVLTKQEAESYNKGEGQSGDTFIFYNTKPDPYEYSRQMKRAKEELEDDM